jgi:hypothetical protein
MRGPRDCDIFLGRKQPCGLPLARLPSKGGNITGATQTGSLAGTLLNAFGPNKFGSRAGSPLRGAVVVQARSVNGLVPVRGVRVRFEVLQGPLDFLQSGGPFQAVQTDDNGIAAIDVVFREIGTALVVADLESDPRQAVFFRGHTEGVTDRLLIESTRDFQSACLRGFRSHSLE